MKRLMVAAAMVLVWQAAQATDAYRWVDKRGKTNYADTPVQDAERVKLNVPEADAASGVDDTSLPYEVRMAKKNFPLTLYVMEKCGYPCDQARDFLKQQKVPFSEVVVKTSDDLAAYKAKSGTENVPALSIGRNWLKGFQADTWREELDAAGYPKPKRS